MSNQENPFADYRWEWEARHVIWLPPTKIQQLSSSTPVFLSGIRGSGKTTLLQVLDPRARQNPATKILNPQQLNRDCIGVYVYPLAEYIKLFQTRMLSAQKREHLFRIYILSLAFSEMFAVLKFSRAAGILFHNTSDEERFSARLEKRFKLSAMSPGVYSATNFGQLSFVFSALCEAIRISISDGAKGRYDEIASKISPATLHRDTAKLLQDFKILTAGGVGKFIKICIDDAHRLPDEFQHSLNSIIQEPRSPISWCICHHSGRYAMTETAGSDPLSGDDRLVIDLSYSGKEGEQEFRNVCRNLFVGRMKRNDQGENAQPSEGEMEAYIKILGRVDSTRSFLDILELPESNSLRLRLASEVDYVALALKKKQSEELGYAGSRRLSKTERLRYYYHTYIYVTLFSANKSTFEYFLKERTYTQVDNYFRQKWVTAVLCAAHECNVSAPYNGYSVVENLSDGCIRQFIKILRRLRDQIMLNNGDPGKYFSLSAPRCIPAELQRRAIKATADQYVNDLKGETEEFSYFHIKLLLAISGLTKLLQTKEKSLALRNPELGLFRIDFAEKTLVSGELLERLRGSIAYGVTTGSVRLTEGSAGFRRPDFAGSIELRLHRIMAGYDGYSSRGPFRAVRIRLADLCQLVRQPQFDDLEKWCLQVYERIQIVDNEELKDIVSSQLLLDI